MLLPPFRVSKNYVLKYCLSSSLKSPPNTSVLLQLIAFNKCFPTSLRTKLPLNDLPTPRAVRIALPCQNCGGQFSRVQVGQRGSHRCLRTVTLIIALFERSLSFEVNTKSTPFSYFFCIYIISLFHIFARSANICCQLCFQYVNWNTSCWPASDWQFRYSASQWDCSKTKAVLGLNGRKPKI